MAETAIGRFKLTMGRVGVPGAPIFEFTAAADAEGKIGEGRGEIRQATPGGSTTVNASGQLRYTGLLPNNDILLSLSGSCNSNERAPAEEKFTASATFKAPDVSSRTYEGTGNFECGRHSLKDVPAKLEKL